LLRIEAIEYHNRTYNFSASGNPEILEPPFIPSTPSVMLVDGPPLPGQEDDLRPMVFATASPWGGVLELTAGSDGSSFNKKASLNRSSVIGKLAEDLNPGPSDRWVYQDIIVELNRGALSSRKELDVLNGKNVCLLETDYGWELIQFQSAELVAPKRYRLSSLLRGQQGTETLSQTHVPAGARLIFIDESPVRLDLQSHELGLEQEWRTRWQDEIEPNNSGVFTWQQMAARAWAPAHLKIKTEDAGKSFEWIRRARIDGDSWQLPEPPTEYPIKYKAALYASGTAIWETDTEQNNVFLSDLTIQELAPIDTELVLGVSQYNGVGETGFETRVSFEI
jgi:hypothetical protein